MDQSLHLFLTKNMIIQFKKILIILSISLMALATVSCSSDESALPDIKVSKDQNEPKKEPSEVMDWNDRWEQYYLLPEKDFIYLAKNENLEEYSKFEYGSWDEYDILKYLSNKCSDSGTFPYGNISVIFDTSEATNSRSAVVSYVCVASAGRGLINTIFLRINDNNKVYTADELLIDTYDFSFSLEQMTGNEIEFLVLGGGARDKKGTGKISFENGKPVVELTSSNDEFIDKYIKKNGSIFNEEFLSIK